MKCLWDACGRLNEYAHSDKHVVVIDYGYMVSDGSTKGLIITIKTIIWGHAGCH